MIHAIGDGVSHNCAAQTTISRFYAEDFFLFRAWMASTVSVFSRLAYLHDSCQIFLPNCRFN